MDKVMSLLRMRQGCLNGYNRRLREQARLSITEVGMGVGVYPKTVARWELGERLPQGPTAQRYAQLLEALARAVEEEKTAAVGGST